MKTRQKLAILGLLCGASAACERQDEASTANDASLAMNPDSPGEIAADTYVDSYIGPIPGELAQPIDVENPYKDDDNALQVGRQLFLAYNCYGCHGGYGGGGMAPSLRDESWIYGNSAADIFDSIHEGRPHSMPAWGEMLPPDLIWQLTAYIQSMRTDREPERPM